jgi:hypothetical protein
MRDFNSLSEPDILALAVSLEEEDERIYGDFVAGLRENFPDTAAVFDGMRKEETSHRLRLLSLYRERFGEPIPLIRRQHVKGFVHRRPIWLSRHLGLERVRKQASAIEADSAPLFGHASLVRRTSGSRWGRTRFSGWDFDRNLVARHDWHSIFGSGGREPKP